MNFSSKKKLSFLIILVNIFFHKHCSLIKPADPNYRAVVFYNEQHSGFISKDFFQIRVEVNATAKELPILSKREDCKRRSILLRNELTIPILIKEVKDIENDRLRGINKIQKSYASDSKSQAQPNTTASLLAQPTQPVPYPLAPLAQVQKNRPQQNTTGQQATPGLMEKRNESEEEIKNKLLIKPKMEYLQGEFSWLLDEMKLFKEDYTKKEKCVFIYRAAKKGLYERLEETKLSIDMEQYP
jgi:hypothetical protein